VTRILIVEDEPAVASFVEKGLRAHGYTTTIVRDGRDAAAIGRDDSFELVILDLGLPGMSGLDVLRTLRGRGQRIPVIILTGRDNLIVDGLDAGADDYIKKPFDLDELLARIRARVRAASGHGGGRTILTVGDLTLDLLNRNVDVAGRRVELTTREYAIAEVLFRHPGQVLSRAQLLSHAWGYDFYPGSNIVDVYIATLRRKLGERRIETVRGMGYRLNAGPIAPDGDRREPAGHTT
jgi:two-component system copper resistance phosphate regulon response regulator CusR